MKKSLIIFVLCVAILLNAGISYAEENNVLKSDIKEAHLIDDTKMQENEVQLDKKQAKKLEKQAKKLEEKERKENKKRLKAEQKEAEKQLKLETKLKKEQEKVSKLNTKKEEKALKKQEKLVKKEAKKLEKQNKEEETKAIVEEDKKEVIEEVKNEVIEEVKEVSEIKEEIKEENEKEVKQEQIEEAKEEKIEPTVYRQNLTFEDIDKNAVSINEFLLFSKKQNEKFSIFYYKTVSKLNAYSKAIAKKETQMKENKNSNLSTKEKLEKAKKLEKEYDNLLRGRDEFYNSSLGKFNSILNKKQQMKWELLQQMGYRFLPEF